MASTIGRGAGWISPSSGRSARSTGAQRARAQPRERGAQQQQPADALVVREAGLDRHPAAHAVAGDVRALDAERVHRGEHRAREPGRVVGRADRLVGLAEAREVERHDPVAVGQRGHGREEGRLRAAEAVEADDRLAARCPAESTEIAPNPRVRTRVELEPAAARWSRWWPRGSPRPGAGCRGSGAARRGRPPSRRARRRRCAARWRRRRSGRVRLGALVRVLRSRSRRPAITRVAGPAAGHARGGRAPGRPGRRSRPRRSAPRARRSRQPARCRPAGWRLPSPINTTTDAPSTGRKPLSVGLNKLTLFSRRFRPRP